MAYNPNSYFNYEAGRGSIYSSPPKSKPKNTNQQAAKSMGSAGIGGLGGKPTTTAAKKIQDNFRRETQKDSGSTYDEIALPTEAEVDKGIKKGLGSPDKSDDDKDQSPIERIKSTLDSVSEMMGLGKPKKPKKAAYTPDKIYSTAAFRARSDDPIDLNAQNRRIDAALDFENRVPMAYLPAGGTYDEITKQRGADERNQKKMAESINATIAQLYAANDPARQFYQSNVPMDQRIFEPELGYDEVPQVLTEGLGSKKEKHKVKKGDTLSEIAQANGTTVEELVRLNDIEDKDVIDVGQEIKLSDTANVNNPQTQEEMIDTEDESLRFGTASGPTFSTTVDSTYTDFVDNEEEGSTAHVGQEGAITLMGGVVADNLSYDGEKVTSNTGYTSSSFDASKLDSSKATKKIYVGKDASGKDKYKTVKRTDYATDKDFTKAVLKVFEDVVAAGAGDDYDDLSDGAKKAMVKLSWNNGTRWANYNTSKALYKEMAKETKDLDTVAEGMLNYSTVSGSGASIGVSKARANAWNAARDEHGGVEITKIVADNTGTKTKFNYYDVAGNLVHTETTSRAPSKYASTATTIEKDAEGNW